MKTQVYLEEEINGLCMGIILYMHRAKFNDRGIVLANHIIIMASVINRRGYISAGIVLELWTFNVHTSEYVL